MESTDSAAPGSKPSVSMAASGSASSSSSVSPSSGIQNSPCAGCKFLRRKCQPDCVFAPYFPPDQPAKFISVHRSFGASNVTKILNDLNPNEREFAVTSLVYEASWRHYDKVNGCISEIYNLEEKLKELRFSLSLSGAELYRYKAFLEAISNRNQVSQGLGMEQTQMPLWHHRQLLQQRQQQFLLQQEQQQQRMMLMMGGHGAVAGEAVAGGEAYDLGLAELMDASTVLFDEQFADISAVGDHGSIDHGQFTGFTHVGEHVRLDHGQFAGFSHVGQHGRLDHDQFAGFSDVGQHGRLDHGHGYHF